MAGGVDFRAVFEGAPEPQLLLGPNSVVVAVTDGYLRATGTAREQVAGRSLFDVPPYATVDGGDAARLRDELERAWRSGLQLPHQIAGGYLSAAISAPILEAGGAARYIVHTLGQAGASIAGARVRRGAAPAQADRALVRLAGAPGPERQAVLRERFDRARARLPAGRPAADQPARADPPGRSAARREPEALGRPAENDVHLVPRGTILVVDDEETVQAVASRMLESLGFGVLVASNGVRALEIYARGQGPGGLHPEALQRRRSQGEPARALRLRPRSRRPGPIPIAAAPRSFTD